MDTSSTKPERSSHRNLSYIVLAAGCTLLVLAFLIGISDNSLGIASVLAGLFAIIIGFIFAIGKWGARRPAQQLLYWSPRALCIVIALFLSIFALDVFGEGRGLWDTTLALLMHLIPSFFVLIVLAISWRREWIGGLMSFFLAAVWVVFAWGKPFFNWSNFLLIAGPLMLTGFLFLINWTHRHELRGA